MNLSYLASSHLFRVPNRSSHFLCNEFFSLLQSRSRRTGMCQNSVWHMAITHTGALPFISSVQNPGSSASGSAPSHIKRCSSRMLEHAQSTTPASQNAPNNLMGHTSFPTKVSLTVASLHESLAVLSSNQPPFELEDSSASLYCWV